MTLHAGWYSLAPSATTTVRALLSLSANRSYVVRIFHDAATSPQPQFSSGSPASPFSPNQINPQVTNAYNMVDFVELPIGPSDDVNLVNPSASSSAVIRLVVFEV